MKEKKEKIKIRAAEQGSKPKLSGSVPGIGTVLFDALIPAGMGLEFRFFEPL